MFVLVLSLGLSMLFNAAMHLKFRSRIVCSIYSFYLHRIDDEVPHKVLRLNGLPSEVTTEQLTDLFKNFMGFKEVRVVSGLGIAFVEYDNEYQAIAARMQLSGAKVTESHALNITFSKK
jgi:hypothetical protein